MRILMAHEYYQLPGGEDGVFETTRDLLRARGHEVIEYVRRNDEISGYSVIEKLSLPARTVWAWDTQRELAQLLAETQPDVAHFVNTFPVISPSAYSACHRAGVAVVKSIDNPRLMCPAGTFFRDGRLCVDCMGKVPLPAVVHACYRGSYLQSAVVAGMLSLHRMRETWQRDVDAWLLTTNFYRRKFIENVGLDPEKLFLRPNFVDPDPGVRADTNGRYALFMGRLSLEKGVKVLLNAWKQIPMELKIRGVGELEAEVRRFAASRQDVELGPWAPAEEKYRLIKGARFLMWPSQGYCETFGNVVAESYACGVPVIAARTGVAEEMVINGRTGLFFSPTDSADLAAKVRWANEHPNEMARMGLCGRNEFESRFTPEISYQGIMRAYHAARKRIVSNRAPQVQERFGAVT